MGQSIVGAKTNIYMAEKQRMRRGVRKNVEDRRRQESFIQAGRNLMVWTVWDVSVSAGRHAYLSPSVFSL